MNKAQASINRAPSPKAIERGDKGKKSET